MFIFALGAQKNRLTETYNLPMLWLDPHSYKNGSFYAHTLPATEGVFSGAEGGGIIFVTDPAGVGHGRNWQRVV